MIEKANKKDRVYLVYGDEDTISIRNVVKVFALITFSFSSSKFSKNQFYISEDTLDTNIQGTTRLLESIKEYKNDAVVHVCSSSEVFGRVSREKLPINEECTFHPASPYAISKVGTDLIGRFYAEAYNMTVMTTRMFTHTGPREVTR